MTTNKNNEISPGSNIEIALVIFSFILVICLWLQHLLAR